MRPKNFNIEISASKYTHIIVRMVFYISMIRFKYIITKKSGIASEIVALFVKNKKQETKTNSTWKRKTSHGEHYAK